MKKLFRFLLVFVVLFTLASCNGDKEEFKLPSLENMNKEQIEGRFNTVGSEVKLIFDYEYSTDIERDYFIRYQEPLKVGDVYNKGDKINIVLAKEMFKLPNLSGKTEAEITNILNQAKQEFSSILFEYSFEYVEHTLAEGRFVDYKEPFEEGSTIESGDQVVILISQEKFRLPSLYNMNKEQIEQTFAELLEDHPSLNLTLQFDYVYEDNLDENMFMSYEGRLVDDVITSDGTIIINLSARRFIPDLTGLNKEEIKDLFVDLLKVKQHGVTFEYEYYYPEEGQTKDDFVKYMNNLRVGSQIKKNQIIKIALVGDFVNYPDLTGKNEQQIDTIFKNLFKNYIDDNYEIVYESKYDDFLPEGSLLGYADVSKGDKVLDKTIVLLKTTRDFILPNLRGLKVFEIEELFISLGIDLDRLIFMPSFSDYVEPGEFIKYEDNRAGDVFNITRERLVIHYDLRPILPNLDGLNKKEIEKTFAEHHLNINFEYVVDNNFEYDTFASYINGEAGDPLDTTKTLGINLYSNDDVNIGDNIANEYELFISKYIDGSSRNQGIELYNATDEEISLDDYYIAILSGGQYLPSVEILLNGTISSKGTYVIVNDEAVTELLNKSDMQTSLMRFGANATIQLRRVSNDTYIDSIYDVGNISILMEREIYVRRPGITHGRRDYRYLEWVGYVIDFYELVGNHPYAGNEDPVFELIEDKTFQQFGMTKVEYLRSADGDTVYFKSLDDRDPTSYDGGNRVRFLLINTPETQKPNQDGEPYAQVAKDFTHTMLASASEIYLQSSKEAGLTDTYDRHLGLIWANVGTVSDPNWKLLNYELLKAGLGTMMISKTGTFQDHPIFGNRYLFSWAHDADLYARENKLGLYSGVHRP